MEREQRHSTTHINPRCRAGFVVSLVPPQSYWDVTTGSFDLSLLHSYSDFHPEFHYRGQNCYTALFVKYGNTTTTITTTTTNNNNNNNLTTKQSTLATVATEQKSGLQPTSTAIPSSTIVPTFDMVMVQVRGVLVKRVHAWTHLKTCA